jgi:hypothetical protein
LVEKKMRESKVEGRGLISSLGPPRKLAQAKVKTPDGE